ncbi:MAG: hypothetical protein A3C27_02560 [Candidatus Levybacteria bacterium RIFCSPHIGHO2_02_FULL_39_36]|nr:MAG: hypothetical protein UT20_C0006G0001 [Candidatus Levybacteria bacterium GW2011_GWA1_39_11]KKR25492.1 MAG: hypothetical protein UT57_C0068G0005 [Microgenomates group bacterium GW2011_GWC1_39_7]OGH15494.1 MAG: hypothetical protein A2689_00525 [Candidatus Levybacteria bacterium RIFCSPHIGHO2_01_FULL_38_96]OGH25366.1 MAG: hypothetical protein A3E68_02110 [Candidatus Levybacteria bacterium RIFCSPHIGHO2_12_FULL_39_39]OGH28771.1 MAG: hypothetical protein A3C27_02560 [Candidatus Levybacteria bac
MDFEEKVNFLRSLPKFRVVPISEIKAIAYAAKEKDKVELGDFLIGRTNSLSLTLNIEDIKRIVKVYPSLEPKLKI